MKNHYNDILSSDELDELIANFVYSKYNYQTLKLVRKASKLLAKKPNSELSKELSITVPNKASKGEIAISRERYKNAKALLKAFFKANIDKFTYNAIKKITSKKYFDTFFLIADALANNGFDETNPMVQKIEKATKESKATKSKKKSATNTTTDIEVPKSTMPPIQASVISTKTVLAPSKIEKPKVAKAMVKPKVQKVASITQKIAPKEQKAKDIIIIKGIGSVIAALLKSNGYDSFSKIAKADATILKSLIVEKGGNKLSFSDTSTWPRQAQFVLDNDIKGLKAFQKNMQ
jgi:hypothetical protein